jgi:hypothetical protein
MWTYQTQRIVPRPVAEVREDVARLVAETWGTTVRVETSEHHGRRTDWIAGLAGGAADDGVVDVVLTWALSDLDDATLVVLTLDELEPGPDPRAGLELVLDALVSVRRAAQP